MTDDISLPVNEAAERTILGAVLLDNAAWGDVCTKLRSQDFSLDSHRRIAAAMKRLMDTEKAVDEVTLQNILRNWRDQGSKQTWLEAIGGASYLASLTEGLPRRPAIADYIAIVKEKSLLRRLITTCQIGIEDAQEQGQPALETIGRVLREIEKLTEGISGTTGPAVQSFIVDALAEINAEYKSKESPCIPSGNAWFDAKSGGGYRHGKISLVCARPNVGKTPWAVMSTAYNLARGTKCVFFSLEMEKGEVLRNLVPYVVDLPNIAVNRPWTQTPEQNLLVNKAMNTLCEWPLSVYDGGMDADQACWAIDRETRHGEEVLFCLDHFGLLAGSGKDVRTRYNENSARLRNKIKHKRSALVVLCQLRKVNREFADKPPIPDDVKESGNMWEDAFAGLLIHRPYEKETVKMSKEAHLNLAKLRTGGATGSTTGHFDAKKLCFEAQAELDYEEWYA